MMRLCISSASSALTISIQSLVFPALPPVPIGRRIMESTSSACAMRWIPQGGQTAAGSVADSRWAAALRGMDGADLVFRSPACCHRGRVRCLGDRFFHPFGLLQRAEGVVAQLTYSCRRRRNPSWNLLARSTADWSRDPSLALEHQTCSTHSGCAFETRLAILRHKRETDSLNGLVERSTESQGASTDPR